MPAACCRCLNSYFGLIYIAAIKNNITIQGERQYCKLNGDGEPDCMSELQSQLAILMLTRLVMGETTTTTTTPPTTTTPLPLPSPAPAAASACLLAPPRLTHPRLALGAVHSAAGNFLEYGLPILLRWLGRLASCCVRRDPDAQAAAERLANAQSASPYEKEAGMPTYDTFNDCEQGTGLPHHARARTLSRGHTTTCAWRRSGAVSPLLPSLPATDAHHTIPILPLLVHADLNIMLQFGFVTLFVVAFPLAPLIALVDAIINSFTDRSRMFTSSARPVPKGASGIGAWRIVFEGLSYASAVSNLTIVVFTNRNHIFGRDLDDNGRLIFFVVAEHVILLLKWGIAMFVPDTTGQTERLLQRQGEWWSWWA